MKKDTEKKSKLKGKKIMKIVIGLVILALLVAGAFIGYKMIQLNKLTKMSSQEMIASVTQKEGIIISCAVIENGEVTYTTYQNGGQKGDQRDLQYEIGSATKTMTALLISKAISEGKVELSASIDKYLDLPDGKYYPTVERLITHTSGYKPYYYESEMTSNTLHNRNSFYQVSKDKMLQRVAKVSLEDKDYPYVYSNFGMSVLGLVLESVYQKDYTELLTEYLHNELSMNDTEVASCTGNLDNYWDWAEGDAYIPAGAVISDIEDMVTYLQFMMAGEEDYVTNAYQSIKPVDGNQDIYVKMGIRVDEMCMAWIIDTENDLIWHNGGTSHFNSYITFNKERTKGVVMLANYGPNENIPVTVIGPKMMEE